MLCLLLEDINCKGNEKEKNTLGLAIIVYVAQNVLEFKGDSRLGGTFFGIRFSSNWEENSQMQNLYNQRGTKRKQQIFGIVPKLVANSVNETREADA